MWATHLVAGKSRLGHWYYHIVIEELTLVNVGLRLTAGQYSNKSVNRDNPQAS